MAARSGKRGGDRILESRHLIGLFLGVVLLCAVFFTLGYVMGRSQYGGSVHAAAASSPPSGTPGGGIERQGKSRGHASIYGRMGLYTNKNRDYLDPAAPALALGLRLPIGRQARPLAYPPRNLPCARDLRKCCRIDRSAGCGCHALERRACDGRTPCNRKNFPLLCRSPTDNLYRVQVGALHE